MCNASRQHGNRAPFTLARRLIDAKKSGSIINMSSQMGHVGGSTRTVYCATKHAMEGFTKAMAIELAPHKIRVNPLAPTFIETAASASSRTLPVPSCSWRATPLR